MTTPIASDQKPLFLELCKGQVESLKDADGYQSKANLWMRASRWSPYLFGAAAITAFVVTGIFAATYLPIATIAILLLCYKVDDGRKFLQKQAEEPQANANLLIEIKREYDALQRDVQSLTARVAGMNLPSIPQGDALEQVKPLVARYEYWRKQIPALNQKAQEESDKGNATAGSTASSESDGLTPTQHRANSLAYRQEALEAKVNAAFVHAIIQRPNFRGNRDDLFHFKEASHQPTDILVEFNQGNRSGPLTSEQVRTLQIHEIAQRIVAAAA